MWLDFCYPTSALYYAIWQLVSGSPRWWIAPLIVYQQDYLNMAFLSWPEGLSHILARQLVQWEPPSLPSAISFHFSSLLGYVWKHSGSLLSSKGETQGQSLLLGGTFNFKVTFSLKLWSHIHKHLALVEGDSPPSPQKSSHCWFRNPSLFFPSVLLL